MFRWIIASFLLLNWFQTSICVSSPKNKNQDATKLISFEGGPVDETSTESTPARNLIITSNLKGNIKVIVKENIGIRSMTVKVNMTGISQSSLSNYKVKYHRKLFDPNTVLLEVHETNPGTFRDRLSTTTFVVIIATGIVCIIAVISAISGCIGVIIVRHCRARRQRRYEIISESTSDSSETTTSNSSGSSVRKRVISESDSSSSDENSDSKNADERSESLTTSDERTDNKSELSYSAETASKNADSSGDVSEKDERAASEHKASSVEGSDRSEASVDDDSEVDATDSSRSDKDGPIKDKKLNKVGCKQTFGKYFKVKKRQSTKKMNSKREQLKNEGSNLDFDLEKGDSDDAADQFLYSKRDHHNKKVNKDNVLKNSTNGLSEMHREKSREGKEISKVDEKHSYHDDEDYLSVHRHGEYNSFVHEEVVTMKPNNSRDVALTSNRNETCSFPSDSEEQTESSRVVYQANSHHSKDKYARGTGKTSNGNLKSHPLHKKGKERDKRKLEDRHSYHDDEDYLSVHRHGEYNSFIHGNSHGQEGDQSVTDLAKKSSNKMTAGNKNGSHPHFEGKLDKNMNTRRIASSSDFAEEITKRSRSETSAGVLKKRRVVSEVSTEHMSSEKSKGSVYDKNLTKKEVQGKHSNHVFKSKHKTDHKSQRQQEHSDENVLLRAENTKTVNGSNVGLDTENLKSAHILYKHKTSSSDANSEAEIEKNASKKRQADQGMKRVIKESINVQRMQRKKEPIETKGADSPATQRSKQNRRPHGGAQGFSGHQVMFIACLFGCLSVSFAISPDLALLQTATADITIEIPAGLFDKVEIFVNKRHNNSVKITGDEHQFSLKVFDVDSISSFASNNCTESANSLCGIGTCFPLTGTCVCPRKFKYDLLSGECIPDCSVDCPPEHFMAKPCSRESQGTCERCRDPCPKGQYESTSCGGNMDRKCTAISDLPPVSHSKNMIAEDRTKAQSSHPRIYLQPNQKSTATLDRETGIEIELSITALDFDLKVQEVNLTDFDKDANMRPSDEICNHQLPLYYIAKHDVLDDKFYYPQTKDMYCNRQMPELTSEAVYCLGQDHDLVQLFTKGKEELISNDHVEGSKLCENLMNGCFRCNKECAKNISKKAECANDHLSCYDDCRRTKCNCVVGYCPCRRYTTNKCGQKASECAGIPINKISLKPVFSEQYSFCHVKMLPTNIFQMRLELYLNGNLITAKDEKINLEYFKTSGGFLQRDFGYMIMKMPDSLKLHGKNLIVRKFKSSRYLEIGHFKEPRRTYGGSHTDTLSLWPRSPNSLSKIKWNKLKCDQMNIDTFSVFGRFSVTLNEENVFEKIRGLSLDDITDNGKDAKQKQHVFSVMKQGRRRFLDITLLGHRSVLRSIFPMSYIKQDGLNFKLLNKTSHWSISVEGYLEFCPGSLTAKVFDQDRADDLMFHYDFAIPESSNCFFKFRFNIPFKNTGERSDKSFVLHLITSKQTMKLVLLKERKVDRILQKITIPPVDQRQLLNAVLPISVIAGGLIFLLVLLLFFGAFTKPRDKRYQIDRNNDFHFRHVFVVAWFVGARLAKSLLFTITFLSYIFVVIHSKNYFTLTTFKELQERESMVLKSIFEDMEKHRVVEINRQEKRFIEEKNLCLINIQKLDAYLSERKRKSSWKQEINKKTRSIKLDAISRFEENWERVRNRYYRLINTVENKMYYRFEYIKSQVEKIRNKVTGHPFTRGAKVLYKLYRFFGGSKNWAQYLGVDVRFHSLKTRHYLDKGHSQISRFTSDLRRIKSRQEHSEKYNHKAWIKQLESRVYVEPPKTSKIKYPKTTIGLRFDNDLAQNIFAVKWILEIVGSKIVSYVGMVLLITLDVLFFVYRHTRTYAMAALMVSGFKKVCDLDKIERDWQKDAERRAILENGLLGAEWDEDTSTEESDPNQSSSEQTDSNSIEEPDASFRRVGEGLSTSTDEYEAKPKFKGDASQTTSSTSSRSPSASDSASKTDSVFRKGSFAVDQLDLDKSSTPRKQYSPRRSSQKRSSTALKPPKKGTLSKTAKKVNAAILVTEKSALVKDSSYVEEKFEKTANSKSMTLSYLKVNRDFKTRSTHDDDSEKSDAVETSESDSDLSFDSNEKYRNFRGYQYIVNKKDDRSMFSEMKEAAVSTISRIGALLLKFMMLMRKLSIVNAALLNTHVILIFFIMSIVVVGVYFTVVTAKFVLRTPVLDELGLFEAKIAPVLAYRKVVNTRTAMNAFTINHIHIPYYEARMNARIEIYRLKAKVYKKMRCVRSVLYNSEYCSWKRAGHTCHGLGAYDDGFYQNISQFKCHMTPAVPKRYSDFDRVQFKNEMMRSYNPYVEAFRGIILDTFQMIGVIIGIQVLLKISAVLIFKMLLSFDLIRQIKVYRTKRPIETWDAYANDR